MIIDERGIEPSARDEGHRRCRIAQAILVLASVENGFRAGCEMVANSCFERVSGTDRDQGAAEIEPIFLIRCTAHYVKRRT